MLDIATNITNKKLRKLCDRVAIALVSCGVVGVGRMGVVLQRKGQGRGCGDVAKVGGKAGEDWTI